MCGDGSASPSAFFQILEAVPHSGEAEPQNQEQTNRKSTAFSHIRRHSRKETWIFKIQTLVCRFRPRSAAKRHAEGVNSKRERRSSSFQIILSDHLQTVKSSYFFVCSNLCIISFIISALVFGIQPCLPVREYIIEPLNFGSAFEIKSSNR
jgi:hypothetical protein